MHLLCIVHSISGQNQNAGFVLIIIELSVLLKMQTLETIIDSKRYNKVVKRKDTVIGTLCNFLRLFQ